jgi:hypothetical protein
MQTQRKTSSNPSPSQGTASRGFDRMPADGGAGSSCRQDAQQEATGLTDGWNFRLLV